MVEVGTGFFINAASAFFSMDLLCLNFTSCIVHPSCIEVIPTNNKICWLKIVYKKYIIKIAK